MEQKNTLLERIGGNNAVEAAVIIFYEKVLNDPELSRFFEKTDMKKQSNHQKTYLKSLLSCSSYPGKTLSKAHADLVTNAGLNQDCFNSVINHLVDTLVELNVPSDLISEIAAVVPILQSQVFGYDEESLAKNETTRTKMADPVRLCPGWIVSPRTYNYMQDQQYNFVLNLIASYATTKVIKAMSYKYKIIELNTIDDNNYNCNFRVIESLNNGVNVIIDKKIKIGRLLPEKIMFIAENTSDTTILKRVI